MWCERRSGLDVLGVDLQLLAALMLVDAVLLLLLTVLGGLRGGGGGVVEGAGICHTQGHGQRG